MNRNIREVGEFWTSKQRAGHSLHEVSYRACFKPQLPEFFINRYSAEGDVVFDPFMGRGTTPLQASLMGRKAIGSDANPLSTHMISPRFNTPSIEEIEEVLSQMSPTPHLHDSDLLIFFHPDTLDEINTIRLLPSSPVNDWIKMVTCNRLTGHSKGFLSVRTLPPNQSVTPRSQARLNEKHGLTPEYKSLRDIVIKKSKSLLKDGGHKADGTFLNEEAHRISLRDDTVDLVVTSPPFLDIVDYRTDNWMRNWFYDCEPIDITMAKTADEWKIFASSVMAEMLRILKPGGRMCWEVGEAKSVDLEEVSYEAALEVGFEVDSIIINEQNFTKTSQIWGVSNNKKGTNSNRIVVAKKPV